MFPVQSQVSFCYADKKSCEKGGGGKRIDFVQYFYQRDARILSSIVMWKSKKLIKNFIQSKA